MPRLGKMAVAINTSSLLFNPMISSSLSGRLDMLRWFAAFMVVLSHIRPLLFVEYSEVENQGSVAIKLLYFVTGFGHEAVIVFFVISGLLVGGVSAEKYAERRFSGKIYLVHRFARIYLVFFPALLAGYLLDLVGSTYLDASGLYSHTSQYRFSADALDRMSPVIALGNSLMLQEILVPALGSNGPLWSLAYEWWYYILFFCALQLLSSRACPGRMMVYGGLLAVLILLLPLDILLWFLIWLTGAAVILGSKLHWRVPPLVGYGLFMAALVWSRLDEISSEVPTTAELLLLDGILAAGCFMLFVSLNQNPRQGTARKSFNAPLAEFSYTLYLVHLPFLLFAVAMMDVVFDMPFAGQPTGAGIFYLAALLAAIYLYAYAFSLLTERYTDQFRRYLSQRLLRRDFVPLPDTKRPEITK